MKFQKGNVPWNKGGTSWNKGIPRSQVVKDAISEANKGKRCGKDNPNYGKHPIPWNKGKVWSDKVKNKISKSLMGKLVGEKNPNYKNRGENSPLYGTKHSPETIEKMRQVKLGENNPCWIDGRSYEPYTSDWTDTLREAIRQRDGYKCQKCGCPQAENIERLDVHHIDYDKRNCNPTNLITLCRSCNAEVNFDRDHWQLFFEERMALFFEDKTI